MSTLKVSPPHNARGRFRPPDAKLPACRLRQLIATFALRISTDLVVQHFVHSVLNGSGFSPWPRNIVCQTIAYQQLITTCKLGTQEGSADRRSLRRKCRSFLSAHASPGPQPRARGPQLAFEETMILTRKQVGSSNTFERASTSPVSRSRFSTPTPTHAVSETTPKTITREPYIPISQCGPQVTKRSNTRRGMVYCTPGGNSET